MRNAESPEHIVYECCLDLGLSSAVKTTAVEILHHTTTTASLEETYSVGELAGGAVYSAALLRNELAELPALAESVDTDLQQVRACATAQFHAFRRSW